jgi:glutathione S-transferase
MYVLHIANKNYSSWSLRPWILLRELGIPFEERLHVFADGSNREAFRAFSPSGTVPCLVDGTLTVWDSFAITEYLAERHPTVWPAAATARAWARSAAAEMHSSFGALRNACSMTCGQRVRLKSMPPALTQDLGRLEELWTDGLDRFGGPFLAGRVFSAVDAFFCPVAFRVQSYALPLGTRARAYVDRLLALPGMAAWYEAGLAETFREAAHEAEISAAGEVIADLRAPPR